MGGGGVSMLELEELELTCEDGRVGDLESTRSISMVAHYDYSIIGLIIGTPKPCTSFAGRQAATNLQNPEQLSRSARNFIP